MNLKNNFKLSKTILSSIILLIYLISNAYCQIFEIVCSPNIINDSNDDEPMYISIMHGEKGLLPENFEIKLEFDNDVFKKNSRIDYSEEINKNYRHSKNIFGNEISIKCSLKPSKSAPDTAENEDLLMITINPKKSISKTETNFKVTFESDLGSETQYIPMKIEKSFSEKSSLTLTKLIPSQGTLTPEFDPNITEYSLNVPYDAKDIEFDARSENGSSLSINRHKLNAPGAETDILITVKGQKRGDKNIYHVTVIRDCTPESENSKSKLGFHNSILKKFISSKKSSKNGRKKSNNGKKYSIDEDDESEDNEKSSNAKVFKEMEMNHKENSNSNNKNQEKLYSIIVLSSLLCLYVAYMVIKKKKHLKSKKELNKISKK